MSDPVIQVWTAPKSAGGQPLGPLPLVTPNDGRLTITRAVTGQQGVAGTLLRSIATDAGLDEGTGLRIVDPVLGVSEWLVATVTDADVAGRDRVTVNAVTVREALTLRGKIRTYPTTGTPTYSFAPGARTVDQLMALYYDPNLAADGLSWCSYAGSDYTAAIDVGSFSNWTYGNLLDAIERRTGYEWEITNADDAGYAMRLVRRRGSTAATRVLSAGVELETIERTRELMSGATVVLPVASGGAAIGETCWQVQQISGTGPYWVVLVDPAGGPAVIREDGQIVGAYLVPSDGAPIEITDSRASDSAVEVASLGGVVLGTLVTLWETSEGRVLSEITSPTGLDSTRGRLVQSVTGAAQYTSRKLAPDGLMTRGLAGWDLFDPTVSTYYADTQSYSRSDPVRTTGAAAGGESSGVTSIDVDGFPAGFAFRRGDVVQVAGVRYECDTLTVVAANGQATVPIAGTLSATIAGDVSLTRRIQPGNQSPLAVRTNGSNSSGASSLTLKDLPASTALASGDQLQTSIGPEGAIGVTDISGSGPITITITPAPFDIANGATVRVTENQFSGAVAYWGGILIKSYSGTSPSWTATISALPVDIPEGTALTIAETRRQLVGNRTFVVTYPATVASLCVAGSVSLSLDAPERPAIGSYTFISASAPFAAGGDTRVITYDATLTAGYTAGGSTITASATRPALGWSFLAATVTVSGTTIRTYSVTGTPSLWSSSGLSTATITGTLSETLPAGTVMRWSRSGVILGDLVTNSSSSGGGNTIELQGGAFVSYVTVGTTFELPAFQTATAAATSADGSGAATLTVPTTPSAIGDNVAITIVRCPDLAPDDYGGPNVLRVQGATGGTTSSPAYRASSIFGYHTRPFRVAVTAGETKTVRVRIAYTVWGTAASQAHNLRMTLWRLGGTSATNLGEDVIDGSSNPNAPYSADLSSVTHGELSLAVDITATTRLALSFWANTQTGAQIFVRHVSLWVGGADDPPMDGADNNALWHKAQDRLETGKTTARYRLALSPSWWQIAAASALTEGQTLLVRSSLLGLDSDMRLIRIVQQVPKATAGPVIECDVLRPYLTEAVNG